MADKPSDYCIVLLYYLQCRQISWRSSLLSATLRLRKQTNKKSSNAVHCAFEDFFYCHSDSTDTSVKGNKNVNIFHKQSYRATICLSTHYKTYCFTFQKRLFCTVKAQVLRRKTAAFATPKRSYHFLRELSLQNQDYFSAIVIGKKRTIISLQKHCLSLYFRERKHYADC